MPGALAGVRVIEFGHHVAAPLAGVLLADQGADVVRVDRPPSSGRASAGDAPDRAHPAEDRAKGARFRDDVPGWADSAGRGPAGFSADAEAFLHRGKRRITLDLTDDADLAVARRLIAGADVVIENFRPGVMDRLGLGWSSLTGVAPRLVYCSMPGFGADDPRAAVPGWEGVIAAATGNCRVRHGEAPDGWDMTRPTYTALPFASTFAALLASYAIVAALIDRHRHGHGERIEVPLFNAVFELIGGAGVYVEERGPQPERPLVRGGSGTYRCGDGRYVQFNPIGSSARFLRWFLDAAGKSAWSAEGLTTRSRIETDPEMAAELRRRLRELFLTRPAQEWEDLANDAGVPLCMVRSAAEWLSNEHARSSGQVVRLEDPALGPTWMAGRLVSLSGSPSPPSRPRHLPDADRDQILAELETRTPANADARAASADVGPRLGADVRAAMVSSGADAGSPAGEPAPRAGGTGGLPFSGTRVVDLTQILAGPSAGRMLAEFGADVVKVNSPQRKVDVHGFVNRGKRSVLLDLESPDGQEVLWRLIDDADVVTVNFPPRTARRYGLSYEHLRARKPDIVYVSVSCYGEGGPWESRRGYETQGQAATGIMERAGRDDRPDGERGPGSQRAVGTDRRPGGGALGGERGPGGGTLAGDGGSRGDDGADVAARPAVLGPYNVLDYGTGVMAAFAASLGLYHRAVTGEGQQVSTSLAQTGALHQSVLLLDHAAKSWDEPAGRYALGEGPLHRFYQASDGWFFLGATPGQWDDLVAVDGLAPVAGHAPDDPRLADALAGVFRTGTAGHWTSLLQAAGVGAHQVVTLPELMTDPWVRARGLSISAVSEEVGPVVMPGTAIQLERHPITAGAPARQPGADGPDILASAGFGGDEIERLEQAWAVQLRALPPGWAGF